MAASSGDHQRSVGGGALRENAFGERKNSGIDDRRRMSRNDKIKGRIDPGQRTFKENDGACRLWRIADNESIGGIGEDEDEVGSGHEGKVLMGGGGGQRSWVLVTPISCSTVGRGQRKKVLPQEPAGKEVCARAAKLSGRGTHEKDGHPVGVTVK